MTMDSTGQIPTIAAVSTGISPGGIAIIRLSGPESFNIIQTLFRPFKAQYPLDTHKLYYGQIVSPATGRPIDRVLCCCMRAPQTYTRQDVAEINSHGGPVVVRRILEAVLSAGARLAEPGEFTRLAFLSGRIDLSQAEAVAELIAARSDAESDLALSLLAGGLKDRIDALARPMIDVLAHLEVSLDFPDEDAEIIPYGPAAAALREQALSPLKELLEAYESGRVYREGLTAAIIGRPNVGKSSLLNRLTCSDRAIVTASPGTTRDVIEAEAVIQGIPLTLLDTAGLESPARDEAEVEGQRRARDRLEKADLVLFVVDRSRPFSPEDRRILDRIGIETTIAVLNKADLDNHIQTDELEARLAGRPRVSVSAKTGFGIKELYNQIVNSIVTLMGPLGAVPRVAPNARHKQALEQAGRYLESAITGLDQEAPAEIIALELRQALEQLGLITGRTVSDEVLDRIFSEFCLGK